MSKVSIELSTLTNIGDAIREKKGTTEEIAVTELGNEIRGIQGGGDAELENKLFTLEGDCRYRFACGGFDWLINDYGDRITARNITRLSNLVRESKIEELPFELHIVRETLNDGCLDSAFTYSSLVKAPYVRTDGSNLKTSTVSMGYMFSHSERLKEIPYDFFDVVFAGIENADIHFEMLRMFEENYSLSELPNLSFFHEKNLGTQTYVLYNYGFSKCYNLREIANIPVNAYIMTSNGFTGAFSNCCRTKRVTFKTNGDGSPCQVSWKSQTIDLTSAGYAMSYSYVTKYSENAEEKWVRDDVGYQALKDDPDWWASDIAYSRYNHDSAVETINSLPDTSAYLSEKGGTNTIKFKGQSGELTDGGAINTLTEEEIAVATAKGWTVTLS